MSLRSRGIWPGLHQGQARARRRTRKRGKKWILDTVVKKNLLCTELCFSFSAQHMVRKAFCSCVLHKSNSLCDVVRFLPFAFLPCFLHLAFCLRFFVDISELLFSLFWFTLGGRHSPGALPIWKYIFLVLLLNPFLLWLFLPLLFLFLLLAFCFGFSVFFLLVVRLPFLGLLLNMD